MAEPIETLSLGAGVQSSTLAFMAAHGEVTPRPLCGIFGDTKAEPKSVYDWLDWIEPRLPFPIYRVSSGDLYIDALKMRTTRDGRSYTITSLPYFTLSAKGEFAKVPHRTCTADYKIKPIISKCRELVGREKMLEWRRKHKGALKALVEWKKACKLSRKNDEIPPLRPRIAWMECQSDPLVIQWIGISLDEASRMKESRDPWVLCRWPLIEKRMTRQDCLRWMEKNNYPKPPRSACVFCPFHNDQEWTYLKRHDPVAFERASARLKGLTTNFRPKIFLHKSCVPLDQVDFRSKDEKRGLINLFENECHGMCGV